MKAKDIMTKEVITVSDKAVLRDVIKLMRDNNISGLPVLDSEGTLLGIVSEADVIRMKRRMHIPGYLQLLERLIYNSEPDSFTAEIERLLKMPVTEFMTEDVVTVGEQSSLSKLTELLSEEQINRVPVIKNGKLVGIVTRRDIIKAFADS